MQKRWAFLIIIFILCTVTGFVFVCVQGTFFTSNVLREQTVLAMGTVVSEKVYGGTKGTLAEIESLIDELDRKQLSWRESDSMLAHLNAEKTAELTGAFAGYIRNAFLLAEKTHGAFDPTLGPLIALWGIEGSSPKVPSEQALADCMEDIGYEKVTLTDSEIILPADMSLDLGAVGKGIALDVLEEYFTKEKIPAAMVAVGGSIITYGNKPEGKWNIAIQHPLKEDGTAMGVLHITGTKFISTSGDYEKYFEETGVKYHHIFDRTTGYPADKGLSSVTVVCDNGLISDGLSTACFVLGYEKSAALLPYYAAEAVFVFQDGSVSVTDGIKDSFELLDNSLLMR